MFVEENAVFVPDSCACPKCSEHNVDNLAWVTDIIVFCETCQTEYSVC